MGDAYRITTDDGANIDEDIKKLKTISSNFKSKGTDKSNRMSSTKTVRSELKKKEITL
jgi:hypothetical protein